MLLYKLRYGYVSILVYKQHDRKSGHDGRHLYSFGPGCGSGKFVFVESAPFTLSLANLHAPSTSSIGA